MVRVRYSGVRDEGRGGKVGRHKPQIGSAACMEGGGWRDFGNVASAGNARRGKVLRIGLLCLTEEFADWGSQRRNGSAGLVEHSENMTDPPLVCPLPTFDLHSKQRKCENP